MRRWSILGLSVLALALMVAPVSAQKTFTGTGYTVHNWQPLANGMDNVNGGYVYFFGNSGMWGTAGMTGDNIRKCWTNDLLHGGQESLYGGPMNTWFSILMGSGSGSPGIVIGTVSVVTWAETVADTDICLAPFTANPIVMVGGVTTGGPIGALGTTPGWFYTIGFSWSGSVILPASGMTTGGTCFDGSAVYELQLGYNNSGTNCNYIGLVTIDEVVYPGGGIALGNPNYGAPTWGSIGIVPDSYSRIVSFSGGTISTLLGQTAEGDCDGFDWDNALAFNEAQTWALRDNGCLDFYGAGYQDGGSGGRDWVGGADLINVRCHDFLAGANRTAGDPDYTGSPVMSWFIWSKTAHAPCAVNTYGSGNGWGAGAVPLDFGMQFDAFTGMAYTPGPLSVYVQNGGLFTTVMGSGSGQWYYGGANQGSDVPNLTQGISTLPLGDVGALNLAHPGAASFGVSTGADLWINGILIDGGARETATAMKLHVY